MDKEKSLLVFVIAILAAVTIIAAPSLEISPAPISEQNPDNITVKLQSTEYRTTYTVKAGDTLSEIAKKYGVDMYAIAEINEEVSIYTENGQIYANIQPGQVLNIPY